MSNVEVGRGDDVVRREKRTDARSGAVRCGSKPPATRTEKGEKMGRTKKSLGRKRSQEGDRRGGESGRSWGFNHGRLALPAGPGPGVQWLAVAQWPNGRKGEEKKGSVATICKLGGTGPKCQWQGEQGCGWPPWCASWRRPSEGIVRGAIRPKAGVAIGTPLDGKTGSAGRMPGIPN